MAKGIFSDEWRKAIERMDGNNIMPLLVVELGDGSSSAAALLRALRPRAFEGTCNIVTRVSNKLLLRVRGRLTRLLLYDPE